MCIRDSYDGVPASAEKKVVVAENDIKTLYDKFKDLSLKDKMCIRDSNN